MDPNFKNFMAWKKSLRGRQFIAQKDQKEIEEIRGVEEINKKKEDISLNKIPVNSLEIIDLSEIVSQSQQPNKEELQIKLSQTSNSNTNNRIEINDREEKKDEMKLKSKKEFNFINIDNDRIMYNDINKSESKNSNISNIKSNINTNSAQIKSNISFNFDTKKNKEAIMNSYNETTSSINNSNNNNKTSSFNKMYRAIEKSNSNINPNNSNNSNIREKVNNKPPANKKRNIHFQLISKEMCAIESDFFLEPSLMAIIKENQGRFDRETRHWYAPYRNYCDIFQKIKECSSLGDTQLHPITNLPLDVLVGLHYSILKFKISGVYFNVDYTKDRLHSLFELPSSMLTNLYGFQKTGIEFGTKKKGRMLLADEMGVGKTIQAVGISAIFKEDWPVLILCPSSLKYNWRDEICNWLKDIITKDEVMIIKSSKDEFSKNKKYYICSYDLSVRIHEKIQEKNFQMVIADEAHYLKSRESKRTTLMTPILQKSKRVLLLSGTPILAKPVEIYPLLRILRPDLFHSFKAFGSRYCDPKSTSFGIDWGGSSNSKELHFILSSIMLRRLKKDVLSELPPKKRQKVEVQTDSKIIAQIKVLLNKSKSNLLIEDEDVINKIMNEEGGDISAEDTLSSFTKAYSLTGQAKLVGIKDYITYLIENNCKFLIFAHHIHVLDGIEDAVRNSKVKYIRIDGTVQNEKRHILVNTFQTDENCLVAILAITACATGLTLTKASTVVFAEMHFTPATMIQAEDRAHRIGQEHNCVNVHYLFGANTVDEVIFTKLREKFFVVSTTLDDKRIDMGVEKLKSGFMGDFNTNKRNEELEDNNPTTNCDDNSTRIIKNKQIANFSLNTKKSKKNLTLTDFFSVKRKNSDTVKSIAEEDEIIENLLNNPDFISSLTNSEIKPKDSSDDNLHLSSSFNRINKIKFENSLLNDDSTDLTYATEINLHNKNLKRNRNLFDDDFNEFTVLNDDPIQLDKNYKYNK